MLASPREVTLSEAGNLRDAQATSFPAFGDGLLEILQCAPGTTLSPGQVTCQAREKKKVKLGKVLPCKPMEKNPRRRLEGLGVLR